MLDEKNKKNFRKELFNDYDLKSIQKNTDFKEDSVREVIILPILRKLGYNDNSIVRSKTLEHPFLKIGSNKKRPIKLIPDYALKVENSFAWVLDAKSPTQNIIDEGNIEQVYAYATHPEIRAKFFALCNGLDFVVYKTESTNNPLLLFHIDKIENYWEKLEQLLSPNSFHIGKIITYNNHDISKNKEEKFDYNTRPLLEEINVRKQYAKRHFGCNAYFTRQSWDIVQYHINNFTKEGDLVLDSFAGSGVTAVESLMLNRRAIHIDINPLSIFLVDSLTIPVDRIKLNDSFQNIKLQYLKGEPKSSKEIEKALKIYKYPQGVLLPKGSDVACIEELFTKKQLAQLSFLKYLIYNEKDVAIKKSLLLAFYNTISIINKTFHNTPKGGGNHFGYYYRYRIAPEPAFKDTFETFEQKFKRVLAGKKEIANNINLETINNLEFYKGSATNLEKIKDKSVDYIYTDPPYGKKIQYLDLSIIWNSWLDLEVTDEDFKLEAIEGGERQKGKEEYNFLIAKSIKEMYRVLKMDRWMSFVFAHKDPEFWHLIIDTAESCGFEYVGAVAQKNGQSTFKKRQNPFTVLSGQLIINFRKVKNPKAIMRANLGMDIGDIVFQTIEGIIAKNHGATLEQINDELIIKGLELGFLDLMKKEYSDLSPILLSEFAYDSEKGTFNIIEDNKFKTHIDVRLRIRYYLISFLRRKKRENQNPTFDEIVLNILPLLKNGITPEKQTILNVLGDIGEHIDGDKWRLKEEGQMKIFGDME